MPKRFATPVELPADPGGALHAAPKQYVDARAVPAGGTTGQVLTKSSSTDRDATWQAPAGGVPTSRQVATPNGSGLSGGGDLTADRSLAVVFGNSAGTAAQGNDGRFPVYAASAPSSPPVGALWVPSNTETPAAPPATVSVDRLPPALAAAYQISTTSTSPLAVALGNYVGPIGLLITCGHDSGLAVPSGTPTPFQVIRLEALASSAQRIFTFNSGIRLSTGLASRAFTIPAGRVLKAAVEWSQLEGAWILTAATVSAV